MNLPVFRSFFKPYIGLTTLYKITTSCTGNFQLTKFSLKVRVILTLDTQAQEKKSHLETVNRAINSQRSFENVLRRQNFRLYTLTITRLEQLRSKKLIRYEPRGRARCFFEQKAAIRGTNNGHSRSAICCFGRCLCYVRSFSRCEEQQVRTHDACPSQSYPLMSNSSKRGTFRVRQTYTSRRSLRFVLRFSTQVALSRNAERAPFSENKHIVKLRSFA